MLFIIFSHQQVHLEKRSEALQSQIADANHANTNLRQQKETCEKDGELTRQENSDIADRLQVALNEKNSLLETLVSTVKKCSVNRTIIDTFKSRVSSSEHLKRAIAHHDVLQTFVT